MRLTVPLIALLLTGCASQVVTPRAYLDEETAATITVVAEPWIFTGEQLGMLPDERDFLNVFAIDVNRMGAHKQYLAVLQSSPPTTTALAPTLELHGGGRTVSLQHTADEPRKLGIAKPLAQAYTINAKWWYYPVDKDVLASVGRAADLQAALISDKKRAYTKWRDGSQELAELTAVLP